MRRKAVFLDRDGTLNRELDFLRTPDEVAVLPGVVGALRRLRAQGFALVVVTNQSGIARGYLDEATLARIHERLHGLLDGLPDAYLHCPHHPDVGGGPYTRACDCRKPAAGLVHRAVALFDLDLAGSWIVGDSARDVLVARGLPLRTALVLSGKPIAAQLPELDAAGVTPDLTCADLAEVADRILATVSAPGA